MNEFFQNYIWVNHAPVSFFTKTHSVNFIYGFLPKYKVKETIKKGKCRERERKTQAEEASRYDKEFDTLSYKLDMDKLDSREKPPVETMSAL